VTLAFQVTASLLQPAVGAYTDARPQPFSLAVGMGFTLAGLLLLAAASSFPVLLLAASLVGMGSSVFHPESLARRAHRLGRAARAGAVAVPGRRQYRLGDRAAAGGLHRAAARAGQRRPGSRWLPCSELSCCSTSGAGISAAGRRGRAPTACRSRAIPNCRAAAWRSRLRS
jgi:hypothetical protein